MRIEEQTTKRTEHIKKLLEIRKKRQENKLHAERERFLKWAMPELKRVNPEKYDKKTEDKKEKFEITIPKDQGEKLVIDLGPTSKQILALTRAREVKVTRQRETKNQRILNLLEKKLTTQELLTRNDISLIRLARFETEEIRIKFLELAQKEENKNSEAAYLVGKNPTVKRSLIGRFKGMLDNGLYIWVYENKDHALARGLLNTTLQEPKYTDPRSEITAKQRISARTEIMIMFASWEAFGKTKAKEFNIYSHTNETALRGELITYSEEEFNQTNEVLFYLGQNKTIITPQNVRKLIERAMKNPNHFFSKGLGLNPRIFLYKDINKLAKWADESENKDTLLGKSLREQIDNIMQQTNKKSIYVTTQSMTETIGFVRNFLEAENLLS